MVVDRMSIPTTMLSSLFFLAFLLSLICLVLIRHRLRSAALPLPPGPKSSWFGAVKLPRVYPWRTYAEWKHVYGLCLALLLSKISSH